MENSYMKLNYNPSCELKQCHAYLPSFAYCLELTGAWDEQFWMAGNLDGRQETKPLYQARESSLVPLRPLTVNFLQKT